MDAFEKLMSRPHLRGAKQQHYVPRFYLAGFAETNLVSCLDRRDGKLNSRTPERTACTPHLYTFEDKQARRRFDIEEMFGYHEGKAAPIIVKMAARERISLDERENLATFIALAALRTPAAIEEAKAVHAGFVKARTRLMLSNGRGATHWIRSMRGPGIDEIRLQKDVASIAQMIRDDSYTVEVDKGFALCKSLRNFSAVASSIFDRDWMVLYAPEGSDGFLTTDHPVVLTTTSSAMQRAPLGYGSAHAQVLFPLAHNCALVIAGDQGRTGRSDIEPDALLRFNRTMAAYCRRYLFGRSQAHLQQVANDIRLMEKPWKPNYSVGSIQSPDGHYSEIFVVRNGVLPTDKV